MRQALAAITYHQGYILIPSSITGLPAADGGTLWVAPEGQTGYDLRPLTFTLLISLRPTDISVLSFTLYAWSRQVLTISWSYPPPRLPSIQPHTLRAVVQLLFYRRLVSRHFGFAPLLITPLVA